MINKGANAELALLTFFLILGASSAALLLFTRVQKGWRRAGRQGEPVAAAPPTTGHAGREPEFQRFR